MRHRPLRMMHALASAAVILLAVLTTADADPMIDGRAYSDAFLKGDMDRVWSRMDGQMQGALGSEETLDQLRSTLRRDFGEEAEVLEEEIGEADGYSAYLRTSRWTKSPGPLVMQWTLDGDGNVAGFFVRPKPVAAESRFLDYQTKTELHLPFEGQWYVYWGGRTIDQNYHAADRAQRFALDLVVRKSETTFEGEPTDLENYFCWDKPILAPAAGAVVTAVSDLPDQAIGSSDPAHPAGNHVVLDFGNGEFGFLAHMRSGSLKVKAGDKVEAGQEVGRCGNSGNTSEPHLHFHLQTTPNLAEGEGLPARFVDYTADGKSVESGEPEQGQAIEPGKR